MQRDIAPTLVPIGFSSAIYLVAVSLLLPGCGSSSRAAKAAQTLQAAALGFEGLEELTIQPDRSWVLRWEPADANGVIYGVYRAADGDAFDFLVPELSTYETMYRYYVDDPLNATPQCFVVRVLNGNVDQNDKMLCTDDQPIRFDGVSDILRLDSGRYSLTWQRVPIPGTTYMIYEKKGSDEYNFNQPSYGGIREDFFITGIAARGTVFCYIVRYYNPDLDLDDNTNEACTQYEKKLEFAGVETIEVVSNTSVRIIWNLPPQGQDIDGFQIFVGSDFSELVGSAAADATEYIVTGLAPGRQYSFGVSAIDAFERQDDNLKIRSIVMPD